LLNDQAFVEAAQALARRAYVEAADTPARLSRIFRLCLIRPPAPSELEVLLAFYDQQYARFAAASGVPGSDVRPDAVPPPAGPTPAETAPLDAAQAAGLGDAPPPEQTAALAALTAVARAVLNLDETMTKE
jgi:hypothetical protein